MKDIDNVLVEAITSALHESELSGDLVISTSTPASVSRRISKGVREVFTGDLFSPEELLALSSLIFHATSNKNFYDGEMHTLTGYTAEEMGGLGKKIRELVTL
jgi:hypothetical protein